MNSADPFLEAQQIIGLLNDLMPKRWVGRQAILELQQADYQWRQMEWVGWYFEFKAKEIIIRNLGGDTGPKYGSTSFDYFGKNVWDFKTHIRNASSHPWAIINDKGAVDLCIEAYGGIGLVMAHGLAEYDDLRGTFKAWHDQLKGGRSDYEKDRVKRGASSRRRKIGFLLRSIEIIWLNSSKVAKGRDQGWLDLFQEGMRNANGSARRSKYMLNVDRLPAEAKILPSKLV